MESAKNFTMSFLARICFVGVSVEFQSPIDGPGMSSVGGIICPQAWQTCCDNLLRRTLYGIRFGDL